MKVLMPKKYQERVINRLFFRRLARHHVSGVSQAMENKRTAVATASANGNGSEPATGSEATLVANEQTVQVN